VLVVNGGGDGRVVRLFEDSVDDGCDYSVSYLSKIKEYSRVVEDFVRKERVVTVRDVWWSTVPQDWPLRTCQRLG
jgi:hypothetical protein